MAKVDDNLFMNGLRGTLGDQLVLKRGRGGQTIVSKKPVFGKDRVFTEAQLARQQAMREATDYGKAMKLDPLYVQLAERADRKAYHVAIADWLCPPRILEVDLSRWSDGSGGAIRVRAQDDVRVVQVKVAIAGETGALLEEGEAQEIGALWWEYVPASAFVEGMQVTVSAMDLPGHVTEHR